VLIVGGCVGLAIAGLLVRFVPPVPGFAGKLCLASLGVLFAFAVVAAPVGVYDFSLGFSSGAFLPTGVVEFPVVSCPGPLHCVAFGEAPLIEPRGEFAAVALTSDGGRRWRTAQFPVGQLFKMTPSRASFGLLGMLACPTRQRCFLARADSAMLFQAATGLPVARSDDGGRTWRIFPPPLASGNESGAISGGLGCMTASTCVLVDGRAALITRNAAATWRVVARFAPPPHSQSVFTPDPSSGVDCPDSEHCTLFFSEEWREVSGSASSPANHWTYRTLALTTSDGGRSWSSPRLPAHLEFVEALWCGHSGNCVLSAGDGETNQLAVSGDWGRAWNVLTRSTTSMFEITCVSASECLGVGSRSKRYGLLESRDGGRSWSLRLAGSFNSLSCSGTEFCTVSGSPALLESTTDGGITWHSSVFR
jgi:hypothetical protein